MKRYFYAINIVMVFLCVLIVTIFVIIPYVKYFSLSTEREEVLLEKVSNVVQKYQGQVVYGEINVRTDATEVVLYRSKVDSGLILEITLNDTVSKSWVKVSYPSIITDEGILIIETKSSNVTVSTKHALGSVYIGIIGSIICICMVIYICWIFVIELSGENN